MADSRQKLIRKRSVRKFKPSFIFLSLLLLIQFTVTQCLWAADLQTLPTNPSVKTVSPNDPNAQTGSGSASTTTQTQTTQSFLSQTLTLTPPEITVQAESATPKGSGWWNSGNYILLWNNGEVVTQKNLESGTYEVEVWAIGVKGTNVPQIQMRVDGRSWQDPQQIGNNNWQFTKYVYSGIDLEAGSHQLSAAYINAGAGQNVAIDKIVIRKTGELTAPRLVTEAENMQASGYGVWNSGSYMLLWANSQITQKTKVTQAGMYELDIYANGQSLDKTSPQMEVKIDGISFSKMSVGNDGWAFRKQPLKGMALDAGTYDFAFSFINQAAGRMLSIDRIVLRRVGDLPVLKAEGENSATVPVLASDPNQYALSFLPLASNGKNPVMISNPSTDTFLTVNYDDPKTISRDVTGDGVLAPDDALTIINFINAHGSGPAPQGFERLDVSGDGQIVAGDALEVINALNSGLNGGPEPRVETIDLNKTFSQGVMMGLDNGGSALSEAVFEVTDTFGKIASVKLTGITSSQQRWKISLSQLTGVDLTRIKNLTFKGKTAPSQVLNVNFALLRDTVPVGPSVVYTQPGDYRLFVREPLQNGTPSNNPIAWEAKGVDWGPDSIGTPQSALHLEFAKWYQTDIPMMAQMGINTVRVYHDFGTGPEAFKILDMFYRYGIKVIMTVDSPVQGVNAEMANISQVVNAYKNHPAILMWEVGNEWNFTNYYKFQNFDAAVQFTEQAAQLIKSLDSNHPVASAIGDFGAQPTANIPNLVPSVDVWGLNIYRNKSFGKIFQQWSEMSSKPMFIGEFGADAYNHNLPGGGEDQTVQSGMDAGLWDEAYFDLSSERIHGRTIGALAFEWNDEWWKSDPQGVDKTNEHNVSSEGNGGQPDGINDEEWFGIVDINRNPRALYQKLQNRYWGGGQTVVTNPNPVLKVVSVGSGGSLGAVSFSLDDKTVFFNQGSQYGARGVTVALVDPYTGIRMSEVKTFDTWTAIGGSHAAMGDLVNYLQSLPQGTIISLAVGDEGGFENFSDTALWGDPLVQQAVNYLESQGSTKIRNIKYNGGWAMIYKKDQGALAEGVSPDKISPVTIQAPLSLANDPNFDKRPNITAPSVLEILTKIPNVTSNSSLTVDYKIDGIQKQKIFLLQEGSNSFSINETNVYGQVSSYAFNIMLDRIAPVGSGSIPKGIFNNEQFTSRTLVGVSLNFTDSGAGLDKMRFSTDGGTSWTSWFDFQASTALDLPPGEGPKEIRVEVNDKAGNIAHPSPIPITLDVTPPSGSVKINEDADVTSSRDVILNLTASDALSGVGEMSVSVDGGLTWSERENFAATKLVTLPAGNGLKTVKYLLYDQVGNNSTFSDTITLNGT